MVLIELLLKCKTYYETKRSNITQATQLFRSRRSLGHEGKGRLPSMTLRALQKEIWSVETKTE